MQQRTPRPEARQGTSLDPFPQKLCSHCLTGLSSPLLLSSIAHYPAQLVDILGGSFEEGSYFGGFGAVGSHGNGFATEPLNVLDD